MKLNLGYILRRAGAGSLALLREFGPAVLAGLLVAGGTWWLTERLEEQEGVAISRNMDTESRLVAAEFMRVIADRSRTIERLAARWQSRPAEETRFRADIDELIQNNTGFRAVEWLEPALETRWVAPRSATLPGGEMAPTDDALRHHELESHPIDAPVVTASVAVGDAHREVLFAAPVRSDDRVTAVLVGVVRLRDLIDTVVEPELRRGYSVTVYEGPFQVFGPVWGQEGSNSAWARDQVAQVDRLALRVQVWPGEELYLKMKSRSPFIIRILGYLLAAIVTIVTYVLLPSPRSRRPAAAAAPESAPPDSSPASEPGFSGAPDPEPPSA